MHNSSRRELLSRGGAIPDVNQWISSGEARQTRIAISGSPHSEARMFASVRCRSMSRFSAAATVRLVSIIVVVRFGSRCCS